MHLKINNGALYYSTVFVLKVIHQLQIVMPLVGALHVRVMLLSFKVFTTNIL